MCYIMFKRNTGENDLLGSHGKHIALKTELAKCKDGSIWMLIYNVLRCEHYMNVYYSYSSDTRYKSHTYNSSQAFIFLYVFLANDSLCCWFSIPEPECYHATVIKRGTQWSFEQTFKFHSCYVEAIICNYDNMKFSTCFFKHWRHFA